MSYLWWCFIRVNIWIWLQVVQILFDLWVTVKWIFLFLLLLLHSKLFLLVALNCCIEYGLHWLLQSCLILSLSFSADLDIVHTILGVGALINGYSKMLLFIFMPAIQISNLLDLAVDLNFIDIQLDDIIGHEIYRHFASLRTPIQSFIVKFLKLTFLHRSSWL